MVKQKTQSVANFPQKSVTASQSFFDHHRRRTQGEKKCPNLQKLIERKRTDVELTGDREKTLEHIKTFDMAGQIFKVGSILKSLKQKQTNQTELNLKKQLLADPSNSYFPWENRETSKNQYNDLLSTEKRKKLLSGNGDY